MNVSTKPFVELLSAVKSSYLESFMVLRKAMIEKDQDPDNCFYAKSAERRFYTEGEYDKIVAICKQIVSDSENKDIKQFIDRSYR